MKCRQHNWTEENRVRVVRCEGARRKEYPWSCCSRLILGPHWNAHACRQSRAHAGGSRAQAKLVLSWLSAQTNKLRVTWISLPIFLLSSPSLPPVPYLPSCGPHGILLSLSMTVPGRPPTGGHPCVYDAGAEILPRVGKREITGRFGSGVPWISSPPRSSDGNSSEFELPAGNNFISTFPCARRHRTMTPE